MIITPTPARYDILGQGRQRDGLVARISPDEIAKWFFTRTNGTQFTNDPKQAQMEFYVVSELYNSGFFVPKPLDVRPVRNPKTGLLAPAFIQTYYDGENLVHLPLEVGDLVLPRVTEERNRIEPFLRERGFVLNDHENGNNVLYKHTTDEYKLIDFSQRV